MQQLLTQQKKKSQQINSKHYKNNHLLKAKSCLPDKNISVFSIHQEDVCAKTKVKGIKEKQCNLMKTLQPSPASKHNCVISLPLLTQDTTNSYQHMTLQMESVSRFIIGMSHEINCVQMSNVYMQTRSTNHGPQQSCLCQQITRARSLAQDWQGITHTHIPWPGFGPCKFLLSQTAAFQITATGGTVQGKQSGDCSQSAVNLKLSCRGGQPDHARPDAWLQHCRKSQSV